MSPLAHPLVTSNGPLSVLELSAPGPIRIQPLRSCSMLLMGARSRLSAIASFRNAAWVKLAGTPYGIYFRGQYFTTC